MGLRIVIITLFIALCSGVAMGQSLDKLREEQKFERAEIERIGRELQKIAGSQKDASSRLILLESKIGSRRRIIGNINAQIALLDTRFASANVEAQIKAEELTTLRNDYKEVVGGLYKATGKGRVGHTMARTRYFGHLVLDSLSSRSLRIEDMGEAIMEEARLIELKKKSLDNLRLSHNKEMKLLADEVSQAKTLSTELKKTASELSSIQNEKRAKIRELEAQIEKAIANEVTKSASSGVSNAPLSKEFSKNKGKLPLPLSAGSKITDRYGVHTLSDGVKVNNKGINIAPPKNNGTVSSIFEGEVRRVFAVGAMGQSVIVRHGEYLSVYSNLESTSVKTGDRVARGATIGKVAPGNDLHFELWKENTPLNPSEWLFNIM